MRKYALVGVILMLLALGFVWLLRPLWLTPLYGEELSHAVQRYFEVTDTIEGNRDPAVMAQVATGEHLKDLIRYSCQSCPRVQVALAYKIPVLEVLDYAPTTSKVRARVESGWHWVSTSTGGVIGECHAQAFTIILMLKREDGTWKVSRIGEISREERNPVDDTPELRGKYCPSG